MRTLKYAILGLINKSPSTGYDIFKEFSDSLGNFWNAKHSQIYPELKKLVEEELIKYDVVITGEVLEKKVYIITEKGKEEFKSWLCKNEEIEPTPKDIFRLRMYFLKDIPKERLLELLENQLQQRLEKISHLIEKRNAFTEVPGFGENELGDYLVLEGAIMREETTVQWLEKCIELCNER